MANNENIVVVKKTRSGHGGRRIFSKILVVIFFLSFAGVTAYVIFFSPFLIITRVSVSGTQELDANVIGSLVGAEINGKYFNKITKNNILLVSSKKIEKIISDRFKRIESVQVKKVFPEALEIIIAERESMFILCSNNTCFIVDNNGIPYARADFESNELKENELLVMNDDGGKEIKIGEQVVTADYMKYLLAIKNELKSELDLEIEKNYRTPRLISGDIRVKTSEGWMIYFDESLPIEKEIEALKLVLEKIEKDETGKRASLEYIDLRIENKVFYKYKTIIEKQS